MNPPLTGTQLGNFCLERLLGSGGMAQVYYGWDVNLKRPVAVKVLDARYQDRPAYAARFLREARTVANWRHENIVQIYYADEQDGLFYFVMEYIDGLDLGKLMLQYANEGELIPHEDVLCLGRAIASALDYSHQKGMIHRDVKPANVVVDHEGRIVLTDFGLVLDTARGTLGQVLGSPHYIAPEQAQSSANAVPQSDLYSLGVILYEMLTGVVPFDDPSYTAVIIQHIMEPPPPPRQINPNLSEAVEAVILKALHKNPQERYASGQNLLDALEEALRAPSPKEFSPPDLPPLPVSADVLGIRSLSSVSVSDRLESQRQAAGPTTAQESEEKDALTGLQLDEYRLEELLGEGGMARVYRGLDVRLNRRAAIKVIDPPFQADPEYMARFEREAQAVARLEHAHIVRIYRYGEDQGLLYMAMQYVEGTDLGKLLAQHRQAGTWMDFQQVRRILTQVCSALDYAHNQGVIHRDVKPANVLLDQQGQAVLTDFGLALLTETGTMGLAFGTPHYIAPEQAISSAKATSQSDLYAVGVILYEMLTGKRPFEADDPLAIALKHVSETPTPPRELRPELSPKLQNVILRAMAKKPEERYANGAKLVAALERAMAGLPMAVVKPAEAEALVPGAPPAAAPTPQPAIAQAPAREAARATPSQIAAAEATTLHPPADRPAAARPALDRRRILLYAGVGLGALALLAACVIGGTWLARTILPTAERTPNTLVEATVGPVNPTARPTGPPATATAEPTPGITPSATATAQPTPPPTDQPTVPPVPPLPASYVLGIYTHKGDSLFLVNHGEQPFPLAGLRLSSKKGFVEGALWEVQWLAEGECVTIWANKDNPKPPDNLECQQVGIRLVTEGKDTFWQEEFSVYYGEEELGSCKKEPRSCNIESGENND